MSDDAIVGGVPAHAARSTHKRGVAAQVVRTKYPKINQYKKCSIPRAAPKTFRRRKASPLRPRIVRNTPPRPHDTQRTTQTPNQGCRDFATDHYWVEGNNCHAASCTTSEELIDPHYPHPKRVSVAEWRAMKVRHQQQTTTTTNDRSIERTNERTNAQSNERTNDRTNEQTNERTNDDSATTAQQRSEGTVRREQRRTDSDRRQIP